MSRPKKKYETFEVVVGTAATRYSETFELPKNVKKVLGVQITGDLQDKIYFRGKLGLSINKQEIFPENKPVKSLMSSPAVEPAKRYIELGDLEAGNSEVKVIFTDEANANAAFGSGYTVVIELECEE